MTVRGFSRCPIPFRVWTRRPAVVLVLALCLFAGPAPAETTRDVFGDAVAAYRAGNHSKALEGWRALADEAHPLAQYNVGLLHYQGHGTTRSYAQALIWFHAAARQGLAASYLRLGAMFERGDGVPRDFEQAYLWYTLAVSAYGPGACRDMALDRRRLLADRLTEAQVLRALAESSEWAPEPLGGNGQPCFSSIAVRPMDEAEAVSLAATQDSGEAGPSDGPDSADDAQDSRMAGESSDTNASPTKKVAPAVPVLTSELPAKIPARTDSARRSASASAEPQQDRATTPGGTMPTVDGAGRNIDAATTSGEGRPGTVQPRTMAGAPPRRLPADAARAEGPAKAETGASAPPGAAARETVAEAPAMSSKPPTGDAAADSEGATAPETLARATPSLRQPAPSRESRSNNGVYVQLGALSKQETADQVWRRLQKRYGEMFGGRQRKIETTRLKSGKTLYRLLAGPFDSRGNADAFCDALQQRNEACFVPRNQRRRN